MSPSILIKLPLKLDMRREVEMNISSSLRLLPNKAYSRLGSNVLSGMGTILDRSPFLVPSGTANSSNSLDICSPTSMIAGSFTDHHAGTPIRYDYGGGDIDLPLGVLLQGLYLLFPTERFLTKE